MNGRGPVNLGIPDKVCKHVRPTLAPKWSKVLYPFGQVAHILTSVLLSKNKPTKSNTLATVAAAAAVRLAANVE